MMIKGISSAIKAAGIDMGDLKKMKKVAEEKWGKDYTRIFEFPCKDGSIGTYRVNKFDSALDQVVSVSKNRGDVLPLARVRANTTSAESTLDIFSQKRGGPVNIPERTQTIAITNDGVLSYAGTNKTTPSGVNIKIENGKEKRKINSLNEYGGSVYLPSDNSTISVRTDKLIYANGSEVPLYQNLNQCRIGNKYFTLKGVWVDNNGQKTLLTGQETPVQLSNIFGINTPVTRYLKLHN